MNTNTTIKINIKTKERLDKLKEYKKETYEEVLKKVLHILNVFRKNPAQAERMLRNIDLAVKRREGYK